MSLPERNALHTGPYWKLHLGRTDSGELRTKTQDQFRYTTATPGVLINHQQYLYETDRMVEFVSFCIDGQIR